MNVKSDKYHGFAIERDIHGQLMLMLADGTCLHGIEVIRPFPISAPEEYISICNAEGHEVLRIDDLHLLPPQMSEMIRNELARQEFIPIVTSIEAVDAEADILRWRVMTDRGSTTFLMEDSDNDIRRLGLYRVMLVDTCGIHYLIPDMQQIDNSSRRILARYL